MELLVVLVIGLIALDLLALRFGYDSRDHMRAGEHGGVAVVRRDSDPTHEQELAREIRQARQRRLTCRRIADTPLRHADSDVMQAA